MKKNISILLFIMFSIQSIHAGVPELIARKLDKKIVTIQKNLFKLNKSKRHPKTYIYRVDEDHAQYLKRVRFQYVPFVAFDLSFFELKVAPIFEFRWTRRNPKGWVNYKP